MSATVRYALALIAAALGGALLGAQLFGLLMGAIVGVCVTVVLVAFSDPRVQRILTSTFNMPFSSGTGRRDNRDD